MSSFAMNGFVQAFEDEFHSSMDSPPVMGLLRPQDLPTTARLAAQYTVCDRWFACVPTSTAPNRLMSMCGTTDHRDTGLLLPDQQTAYDWLSSHKVNWRVYSAGLPFFALMPRLETTVLTSHFRSFGDLANDLRTDTPATAPQVIFIEPDYYDCPVHFRGPCDNHAPLAIAPGEAFLGEAYRVLAQSGRWKKTVFVVTYDEHGGFFDHVPPLPIKYRNPNGVAFDTTGPRVPAIVGGPFARHGAVAHAQLDNTSILQLLAERFGAPGEAYSGPVADRARQGIASLSSVLVAAAGNTGASDVAGAGFGSGVAAPPPTPPTLLRQNFDRALRSLLDGHRAEVIAKYPALASYP
jgi:phospholipase C